MLHRRGIADDTLLSSLRTWHSNKSVRHSPDAVSRESWQLCKGQHQSSENVVSRTIQPPFVLEEADFSLLVTSDKADDDGLLLPTLHPVYSPDLELRSVYRTQERRQESDLGLIPVIRQ